MENKNYEKMLKLHSDWSEIADKITKQIAEEFDKDYDDVWQEVAGASTAQWSKDKFVKEIENLENE